MLRRAALLALAAGLLAAAPAQAAPIIVTGNGDTPSPSTCPESPPGSGLRECATLRDAIFTANALPGADQIALGSSGTIQLTAPTALAITSDVALSGPGAGLLTIGGDDLASRVFELTLGAQVTMTGFTIGGGFTTDAGGGVLVASPSNLTLTGIRVRGGQATFGGGIAVRGTLVAQNSLIDGNFATDGGGLYAEASGAVQLINVTIAKNEALSGGGIYSTSAGQIDMTHVTVGRNTGAGVEIAGPASALSSIVAANTGPACVQTTFTSTAFSVAGDASCGFPVVADPGLSADLVDTGGEFATYVPDVLTIPAGSPAEDVVTPCTYPFDQRFGQRFTVALAPCDAGAYERSASGTAGQPPVPTPTPPIQTPTPTPTATPTPEPTPEFRQSVVVEPVRGTVLVCPTRPTQCTPLRAGDDIRFGSTIDTRKGEVELTSLASAGGKPQTARFKDGLFKVVQSGAYTELQLNEELDCRSRAARTAQKKPKARKLWGDGKGKFRTKGRYAAATVRGTKWLVQDTCTTTVVRVTQGSVSVRDQVRKRNVVVRKGKSYTARAKR